MAKKTVKDAPSSTNRRDHLANERTFLAWVRTSIGIMAFGFVVEKFALFIRQISLFFSTQNIQQSHALSSAHQTSSSVFGIFLVGFGALMGLFAFIKYRQIEKQIEENNFRYSTTLAAVVTTLVVLIGIFLVVYLI